jgi:NADPH-dependent ferric siderophore reductase
MTMGAADRELEEVARARTFLVEVVAVEDVHPHLRRITVAGPAVHRLEPAGPDAFVYVLVPPSGRTELGIDETFTWEAYADMPEGDRPVGAYYTVRRWRPDAGEVDLLAVLHGDAGPGSAWAGRARPGDRAALWGPRTAFHPPAGTASLVLVADDTGLPAAAAILDALDDGVRATVVAEVDGPLEQQALPSPPLVDVVWVHRDGAAPGTTTGLLDAVRALPPFGPATYVWGGAESRCMTAVRRHVRDERRLPRHAVSLVAYWRR